MKKFINNLSPFKKSLLRSISMLGVISTFAYIVSYNKAQEKTIHLKCEAPFIIKE